MIASTASSSVGSHAAVRAQPVIALAALLGVLLFAPGCVTRRELDPARARQIEAAWRSREFNITPELARQILALDPLRVTDADIRNVLSRAPAPRVFKIRGGTQLVYRRMASFSEFLVGMGYPEVSVVDPGDGRYAYNCYESSQKLTGMIGWYYEQEGLRPLLVGHSQGGMQAVKILHRLADPSKRPIPLWNPLTWQAEDRTELTDPVTGQKRPLVGLVLPYASAVGAGGLTRVLPNQWEMNLKLRSIPDTVEEFTGFCKEWDLLGGDFLGYGSANHYRANGKARVQNVWLPEEYDHATLPETRHLAENEAVRNWINSYQPSSEPVARPKFDAPLQGNTENILWAAEVWYRIKKHWVLEVQRYVRSKAQLTP